MIDNLIVGLALCGIVAIWVVLIHFAGFAMALMVAGSLVLINCMVQGRANASR
jgi:hypothetical protein